MIAYDIADYEKLPPGPLWDLNVDRRYVHRAENASIMGNTTISRVSRALNVVRSDHKCLG